jgi:hypothetical protein
MQFVLTNSNNLWFQIKKKNLKLYTIVLLKKQQSNSYSIHF